MNTYLLAVGGLAGACGLLVGLLAPRNRLRELSVLGLVLAGASFSVLVFTAARAGEAGVAFPVATALVAVGVTLNSTVMVRMWRLRARALQSSRPTGDGR
jgi:multidrug transporter EmrE-like cation transporter